MGSGITSDECHASNNISEAEASEWLRTSMETITVTFIAPIILCLGVTTNLSFLFVLFRVPKMRSETYIYLMHLALADLLVVILAPALHIWKYNASPVANTYPFTNSTGCVSYHIAGYTAYFTSIALVTLVTFERFFATCHPLKHLKIRGKQRTYRLIAICWLVGLVLAGVTAPRTGFLDMVCVQWPDSDKYQGFPSTAAFCMPVEPWVLYYTEPLWDIPWLITMVANIYMYVRILLTLNKRSGATSISKNDKKTQQTRNQVAKMLIVNGVVFFLCQTPNHVLHLFWWICLFAQIPDPMEAALGRARTFIPISALYVNSVINPLIYGAVNSDYRAACFEAFHCKARSRKKGPVAFSAAKNTSATVQTSTNNELNETSL